jgi:hypothetical protein
MISKLAQQINKPVLVSMPSIFQDNPLLLCTLIDVETCGLWLESRELVDTLAGAAVAEASQVAFVPFTQIAFLMEGRVVPPSGIRGAPAATPSRPQGPARARRTPRKPK